MNVIELFNPAEPRDAHGRWLKGGGVVAHAFEYRGGPGSMGHVSAIMAKADYYSPRGELATGTNAPSEIMANSLRHAGRSLAMRDFRGFHAHLDSAGFAARKINAQAQADVEAIRRSAAGVPGRSTRLYSPRRRNVPASEVSSLMQSQGFRQASRTRSLSNQIELSAQTARLASTPHPLGRPGGPGLWGVKGMQLPPYIQNIARAIMRKRGLPKSRAIAIARAATKRWQRGGGHVHPEVRAASAVTSADWMRKQAVARSTANPVPAKFVDLAVELSRQGVPDGLIMAVIELAGTAEASGARPKDLELAAAHGHHVAGTPFTYTHGWKLRQGASAAPASSPLSSAHLNARAKFLERSLDLAFRSGRNTAESQTIDGHGEIYTPERAAVHNEIVNEVMRRAESVPNGGNVIFGGGLPGAGKTTALKALPGMDTSQYLAVAPDDFKEELGRRGLIPELPGLTPLEASPLVSDEAHHIANMVTKRATAQRKNIIIDLTMNPADQVAERVAQLRSAGYRTHGVYVDVPLQTSIDRAMFRWKKGLEESQQNRGIGGRYVPPADIRKLWGTFDPETSKNEIHFEALIGRGVFDEWEKFDNSQFGHPPRLLSSSSSPIGGGIV